MPPDQGFNGKGGIISGSLQLFPNALLHRFLLTVKGKAQGCPPPKLPDDLMRFPECSEPGAMDSTTRSRAHKAKNRFPIALRGVMTNQASSHPRTISP